MNKKIGIKLSGGADSAIVYYNVCKENPDAEIYVITLGTDAKPYYPMLAARVIDKVYELTGVKPVKHITQTIPHSDKGYVTGQELLAQRLEDDYGISVLHDIYSGISCNCNIPGMLEYFKTHHGLPYYEQQHGSHSVEYHIRTRDTTRDEETDLEKKDVHAPFVLLDKKDVAKAYRKAGVLEELYPNTCSCESVKELDDDGYPIHCGECFFCLERYYAFGRLV